MPPLTPSPIDRERRKRREQIEGEGERKGGRKVVGRERERN
jgi:hypothetical protein